MASVIEKKSSWTVYHLWGWILLVWSLYRRFLKLPEWADEFIFKPLVFVAPVLWYVRTIEKRKLESIGLTGKNFFSLRCRHLLFKKECFQPLQEINFIIDKSLRKLVLKLSLRIKTD